MNIYFHIEYRTKFGEELVLNIVKDDDSVVQYRMTTADGKYWTCRLEHQRMSDEVLDYFYSVECEGRTKRHEWRTVAHRLELSKTKLPMERNFYVYDHWIDIPEDSYRYSSAFTDWLRSSEVQEFRSSGVAFPFGQRPSVQEFRSSDK
ncbi:MAG: hypothetical protein IKZ83_02930, partial [Prevotella sp.]|nr:hypothetical protein [Prevotella sp.]